MSFCVVSKMVELPEIQGSNKIYMRSSMYLVAYFLWTDFKGNIGEEDSKSHISCTTLPARAHQSDNCGQLQLENFKFCFQLYI
jgi:hypothetical protein